MNRSFIINSKWELGKRLGEGSYGTVYSGKNLKTNEVVAIKLEEKSSRDKMLEHEYRVYQRIVDDHYQIPNVYWFGTEGDYNVMVMESIGPNLEELMDSSDKGVFDVETVCQIGVQLLLQIEHMHRNHYLHRDLKPENMLWGRYGRVKDMICLVDMGLAKKFKSSNGAHIKYRDNKMIGTARYCSISSHQHKELSRRDDLISLGYILIYLLKGSLPWQNIKSSNKSNKHNSKHTKLDRIMRCKENTSLDNLCNDLPPLFLDYMVYTTNLKFTDKPLYRYLRDLFWQKIPTKKLTFKYSFSN